MIRIRARFLLALLAAAPFGVAQRGPIEQQLTFTAIEGVEPPPPVELAGADSSAD